MMKSRSEAKRALEAAVGTRVPTKDLPRAPDGHINNCAIVNGADEEKCQMCGGVCPDKTRLVEAEVAKLHGFEVGKNQPAKVQSMSFDAVTDSAETSETVTYTWGPEKFSVVQYNTVDVGPFSRTTRVRKNETVEEAYARVRRDVMLVVVNEFDARVTEHLERIKQAHGIAERMRGR